MIITAFIVGITNTQLLENKVFADSTKVSNKTNSNTLKENNSKSRNEKTYDSTNVVEASVTSAKDGKSITHTLDSSMKTAWEENSLGSGVGEVLSYKFDAVTHIARILITNGDVSSKENFYNKNRIAKAKISYFNEYKLVLVQQVEFKDGYTQKPHNIEPNKKVDVNKVKIEVTAVHKGKQKNTLAVSEVTFGNLEKHHFKNKFNQLREK